MVEGDRSGNVSKSDDDSGGNSDNGVIVTVHVIKRMEMVDGMVVRVVREVMVVWVGAVIMC